MVRIIFFGYVIPLSIYLVSIHNFGFWFSQRPLLSANGEIKVNYLILNNSLNYLSDARYDQFQKWGWLAQLIFILINWIADILFTLVIPLFGLILAYVYIHPLRCLIASPSYVVIAR